MRLRKRFTARPLPLLLSLLALLVATIALAQAGEGEGIGFGGFLTALIGTLAPVALDLAAMLGLVVLAWVGNWIRRLSERTRYDSFRAALDTLDQVALTRVTAIYQESINDLKNAAEDGKLTVEEMVAARDKAIDEIVTSLPGWLMDMLKAAVGGGLQEVIDRYITPAVERAVTQTPAMVEVNAAGDPEKALARLEQARARIGLSL